MTSRPFLCVKSANMNLRRGGYSDANYYDNVIPNAICPNCGLNSNGETAEKLKARMGRTYVI
jgi:hypothetical protein